MELIDQALGANLVSGYPAKLGVPALWSWRYVSLSESVSLLTTKMGMYFLLRSILMSPVLESNARESGARGTRLLVVAGKACSFKERSWSMLILCVFAMYCGVIGASEYGMQRNLPSVKALLMLLSGAGALVKKSISSPAVSTKVMLPFAYER